MRFQHMSGVYAGKYVGYDLQWYYLAVPGLWGAEWLWESVNFLR